MKNTVLYILFFMISGWATAQSDIKMKDIKIEDHVFYYKDQRQFIIEDKMLNEIFIKDIYSSEMIITMVIRKAPSPGGVTKTNPDGMDPYYEFTYLKTNAKCDYRPPGLGLKSIGKDFLYYGIFENGVINESNVNKFISIKGSPYTNRNNQTIIIR
jgi:hypothetical protein